VSKPQVSVRTVPIEDLILDTHNANKGTARGRAMVEKSLTKLGAGRSILIDKHGHVIAGNKTLEAARKSGRKTVTVIQTDGEDLIAVSREDLEIDSEKGRELAIADNRSSELGLEWDAEALKLLDVDLEQFWNESELRKLLPQEDIEAPEPQLDKAAELQKKWKTERGQIWEIGRHRLMCGDCAVDLDALLRGQCVDLCLTDPPYGVGLNYGEYHDGATELQDVISKLMPLLLERCGVVAMTTGISQMWVYPKPTWVLCWFYGAGQFTSSWGFNCWQPIIVYGKDPFLAHGDGSRPDAVDMNTPANAGDIGHPCPKPLKFWQWCMQRVAGNQSETILDPFVGSGTSLVVAQEMGLSCYAMELDPKYVAVALERMAEMGLKPKLVQNGR
jgi:DNA methylase